MKRRDPDPACQWGTSTRPEQGQTSGFFVLQWSIIFASGWWKMWVKEKWFYLFAYASSDISPVFFKCQRCVHDRQCFRAHLDSNQMATQAKVFKSWWRTNVYPSVLLGIWRVAKKHALNCVCWPWYTVNFTFFTFALQAFLHLYKRCVFLSNRTIEQWKMGQ